jgi:plasmid maintenance system antidote protein VapI
MTPISHPGRLLKRELAARKLTADTAVRLRRYFGNGARFWLNLQSPYAIAVVEREHGSEIAKCVRPADAA